MLNEQKLLDGKIFFVDDEKCFSIGSRRLTQSDVSSIAKIDEIVKVLFYYIIFDSVDFSIFKGSEIKQFSFLHGNFSGEHLRQLAELRSLKTIQVLDTEISDADLALFKINRPDIAFK